MVDWVADDVVDEEEDVCIVGFSFMPLVAMELEVIVVVLVGLDRGILCTVPWRRGGGWIGEFCQGI